MPCSTAAPIAVLRGWQSLRCRAATRITTTPPASSAAFLGLDFLIISELRPLQCPQRPTRAPRPNNRAANDASIFPK
jgi:hypothetical protein